MKELVHKAAERLARARKNASLVATGLLRGELGRVGPARIRPATGLTLIWLQSRFGSLQAALGPLLGEEPDVERLIWVLAIVDVSTRKRPLSYEKGLARINKLRRRLARLPAEEIVQGAELLVLALGGLSQRDDPGYSAGPLRDTTGSVARNSLRWDKEGR